MNILAAPEPELWDYYVCCNLNYELYKLLVTLSYKNFKADFICHLLLKDQCSGEIIYFRFNYSFN